jgi:hypothetical protein
VTVMQPNPDHMDVLAVELAHHRCQFPACSRSRVHTTLS